MIWIIGGTTESNMLCKELNNNVPYILTIATTSGLQFVESENVSVGRMTVTEMIEFIYDNKILGVVDLSHPFAEIVSSNARKSAEVANIPYYRYVRDYDSQEGKGIYTQSIDECLDVLKKISGTVLFTTGSKNISIFETVRKENRFIYRVLPTSESLKQVERENIKVKDIIAMLGPFSVEMNQLLLREYQVRYCVTKESGHGSGFQEKMEACTLENVIPIVIKREKEEGFTSLTELKGDLVKRYGRIL